MRISDYLKESQIVLTLKSAAKDDAIRELAATLRDNPKVTDLELFIHDTFEREQFSTTDIGHDVAIPHARTEAVSDIVIALGRAPAGIDFAALDGRPVRLVFLMGTPKRKHLSTYLSVLARLTRLLEKASFREDLLKPTTAADVVRTFERTEA
jgi:fructose-specific phosphotransferase system IIA component